MEPEVVRCPYSGLGQPILAFANAADFRTEKINLKFTLTLTAPRYVYMYYILFFIIIIAQLRT